MKTNLLFSRRNRWFLFYFLCFVVLFVLFAMPAEAGTVDSGTCGDNLTWTLDDKGSLTISGTGRMNDYSSSYYSRAPWYSRRSDIISVDIYDGITSIGDYAFYDCSGLTSVSIPSSVTSIGYYAFAGCSGLISVTIPNNVTSMGWRAFGGCSRLKTAGPIGGGYDYEFGWTDTIPDNTFSSCSGLISVTIPDSVTSIGTYAFGSCSGLTSITIPGSVTSIGSHAFYRCSGLTSVTIPDSVTSIGDETFYGCSGLTSVTISGSVTNMGISAFSFCSELTSVIILDGVTSIGVHAFTGCSGLTSVTIPDSVTSIGEGAFNSCTGLTRITIPGSVTSIGVSAFSACYGLTSVTIPGNVTSINYYAFAGCSGLTSVTIPDSVTSICDYAFDGCSSLDEVIYSGSADQWNSLAIGTGNEALCSAHITYVYIIASGTCGDHLAWTLDDKGTLTIRGTGRMTDYDLYDDDYDHYPPWYSRRSNINSVTISSGVTSIGKYAFFECSSLTSVTIPDGITSIGYEAFWYCSSLTSVTIPDGVIIIGGGAFSGCSGLTSITIPDGVIIIGNGAFYGCSSLTSVTIPDSITSIGEYAFFRCSSLTSVTIPSSVTSIDYYAFDGCSSLDEVIYLGSANQWNSLVIGKGNEVLNNAHITCAYIASGRCGDNLTWTLDNAGTLTISGTGRMADYYSPENCAPWYSRRSKISSVTISSGVTSIGDSSFLLCSGLTNVTIPDSVTSIGEEAFDGCSSLTSVTIPDSVTSIGEVAFDGCSGLKTAGLIGGGYNYEFGWTDTIPDLAFSGCSGLTNISIPNSITSIGWGAFSYCSGLTSVTIPDSVTSIGEDVFTGCSSLTRVTLPCVVDIGEYAIPGNTQQIVHHKDLSETPGTDPTCETPGMTAGSRCEACGKVFGGQEIPALGHTPVTDPAVAPTDTRPGLTEGSHCSVCGKVLTAQEAVHPLVWDIEAADGEVTIVRYYGTETDLMIPSALEGMPVRGIASGAFPADHCPVRVYISVGVRTISNTAFGQGTVIYCREYSEADYWADENGYTAIYTNNTASGTFYRITMPEDFTMEYGEVRELGASVWPMVEGTVITVSSSDPSVAAADSGKLTAVGAGQAVITLTVGGKTASVSVTVYSDLISFAIVDAEGKTGDPFFVSTKTDMQLYIGEVVPEGAETSMTWASSDTGIVVVSADGLVTAKRPGTAVITATAQNGLTRSCEIVVTYPVSEIVFDQSEYSIPLGGKIRLNVRAAEAEGGHPVYPTVWTSSDELIAAVDQKGNITAFRPGTVTITAEMDNGASASCRLTVREITNILSLPLFLTDIESEAFAGLTADAVRIPASVVSIADDAFAGSAVVILAPAGSYAARWADEHGFGVMEE